MRRFAALLCLCAFACNGPKGSPEGTLKSYFSAVNKHDFDTCSEILASSSIRTIGSREGAAKYLSSILTNWSDFDLDDIETFPEASGTRATVKFTCKASVLGIDHKLHDGNCSGTYGFEKQEDGNWYLVLPETERLRPM